MKYIYIIVCLLLFGGIFSCAQNSSETISTAVQFNKIASAPLYQKYGNVKAVKILYHLNTKKLYFINGKQYNFHYEFVQSRFEPLLSLENFNNQNYGTSNTRKYLLGNVNYYSSQNRYVLEIGPSDQITAEQLETMYKAVKENCFFGENLYFLLNTTNALAIKNELSNLPCISPQEIYSKQIYQPLHKGKTTGELKIITNLKAQENTIKATDILVLNESPIYLPICAGIIINSFQTPLSHVSILGKNRKIPVCAFKAIFKRKDINNLAGQMVKFKVEQDTFYLEKTNSIKNKHKPKKVNVDFNLELDSLLTLNKAHKKYKDALGSKAYYFSELVDYSKNLDFKTPESAFAIPFYYYEEHLKKHNIKPLIEQAIANNFSKIEQEKRLLEIRKAIKKAPVNKELLDAVNQKIIALGGFKRMRFRSSTNAEDLEQFSGAGLYNSKTAILNDSIKTIEKAIQNVWASTYNSKAFFERNLYGINHQDVKMGILVHRSFPDEEANGVAITTNLYRKDYIGYVLNLQKGDVAVVNQNDTVTPEQLIVYPADVFAEKVNNYDILSYSSLSPNTLLLTKKEYAKLANLLKEIKTSFYRNNRVKGSFYNFALDIEFKIDKQTRALYLKQMRPY